MSSTLAFTACGVVWAQPSSQLSMMLNIEPQPLESAIRTWAAQTGYQVLVPSNASGSARATPLIHGQYTPEGALKVLLASTDLAYTFVNARTVAIGQADDRIHLAQATGGAASSSTASSGGDKRDDLSVVVVTAQKRVERLYDVPVPVSAVGADALLESNQLRLQDYYTKVPGLSVTPALYGAPRLTIRGVTTGGFTNPTVGVTIDDVPYGGSSNLSVGGAVPDLDPSELSRVEVLRGPQGTLYGASSIGGLLKYVTVDPSTQGFSGYLRGGINTVVNGHDPGYSVRGGVNVPVGDTLAVRMSGFTRRDPGYIDDPTLGHHDVNAVDVDGGRFSALWSASENFSVKLSALIQHSTADGSAEVERLPTLGDLQQSQIPGTGWFDKKIQAYSASLNAKVGTFDIAALSGYSINKFNTSEDFSGVITAGAELLTFLKTKKFTQELRASTPLGTKAEWLVGVFYDHEDSPGAQQIFLENPATGAHIFRAYSVSFPFEFREYAAFTDFTYHFTDRFDVQVGGRQSRNEQKYNQTTFSATNVPTVVPELDSKDNAFTFLVTPRFKISDSLMVYSRIASGFRPGGPNSFVGVPPQYDPDKTLNYEIGVKGSMLDRAVMFDASAYYIDWKNFQLLVRSPTGGSPYYANGSRAHSQGVEFSIDSSPMQGMSLSAWVAWNDASLVDDLPPTAFNAFGQSGDRLPYSSRFSGALSLEQNFPLGNVAKGFAGVDLSYVGDRRGTFASSADPLHRRETYPAYAQLDLRAGMNVGMWTVTLFGSNVADRRGILGGGRGNDNPATYYYIQPRTVGLLAAMKF